MCKQPESHGKTKTKEYRTWRHMIERCYNINNPRYKDYGGRGIIVCEEWRKSFSCFLKDMGEQKEGMSIDRIDNDGNYCPENCKWSTNKEQHQNLRNNNMITYNGITKPLGSWRKEVPRYITARIERGWDIIKAFTHPKNKKQDNSENLSELARKNNINTNTFFDRIHRGWSIEKALNTPVQKKSK
jgi:hypothetical protein